MNQFGENDALKNIEENKRFLAMGAHARHQDDDSMQSSTQHENKDESRKSKNQNLNIVYRDEVKQIAEPIEEEKNEVGQENDMSQKILEQLANDISAMKDSMAKLNTAIIGDENTIGIKNQVNGIHIALYGDVNTNTTGIKTDIANIKTDLTNLNTTVSDISVNMQSIKDNGATKIDNADLKTEISNEKQKQLNGVLELLV